MDGRGYFEGWHILVLVGVAFLLMTLVALALVWSEVSAKRPKPVPRQRYRRPPSDGFAGQ